MDFFELARSRYSVRRFTDEPVHKEDLDRILEAANEAPTGCNKQPHRIIVAQSSDAICKLNELSRCIFGAKTVLIFALNETEDWKNPIEKGARTGIQDVSIVATHVMLAAWELGIGTCWVNFFPNSELDKAMNLPENVRSVLIMPMGYPSKDSSSADGFRTRIASPWSPVPDPALFPSTAYPVSSFRSWLLSLKGIHPLRCQGAPRYRTL